VLLSGRLRNAGELAAELGEPDTDPEHVVAVALERWGEAALARLRGAFALVAWDPASDTGFLAVDQLGVGGLFLAETGARLAFATEVHRLLPLLSQRPAPDEDQLVCWIGGGTVDPGATLFRGVRRLEGGHIVRRARGRTQQARYWEPRYEPPTPLGRADAADALRAGLTASVRSCVLGGEATGVQLSGGLDSSIVAALAARLEPPVSSLTAYTLVHPDHPELDESAHVDRVIDFVGLRARKVPVRTASVLELALEYQVAWELPATSPLVAFNLPLLRAAADEGVAVLLDGEGGDELLGCSEFLLADRVRRGDLRTAVALARRLPGMGAEPTRGLTWAVLREFGLKGALPHAVHRGLRRVPGSDRYAPSWLRPSAAKRYAELVDEWSWKELDGPRWWSALADLLTAGRVRLGAYDLLRRRAALAGIVNTHPLLESLDLVELVLRLPPELALDPTLTRPLAREAVAGLLPVEVRLRPDKVDFSPLLVEALGGPDWPLVTRLLGADDSEVWAYVERDDIRALLARPTGRRTAEWARVVARLATAESWLRAQSDAAFPGRVLADASRLVSAAAPAPLPSGDRASTA
jgi:asparagine synthase (glutamine-hydrolysing)